MAKHILSKSSYIRGLQCHKSLYLYKKRYFLRDPLSPEQQARFKRGTDVGVLARRLFPGGVDASPASHFQFAQSVKDTAELVANGSSTIYEAAFQAYEVLVALDILVKDGDAWIGYEVKSSLRISPTYLEDAALQYWVIKNSGLNIKDIRIVYMNPNYTRGEELDIEALFCIESVLSYALDRYDFVGKEISRQLGVTKLPHSPAIPIGKHCFTPYVCDFMGHCWKAIPKNNILQLTDIPEETRFDWLEAGIIGPDEMPAEFILDAVQQIQRYCHLHGSDHQDQVALRNFLSRPDGWFILSLQSISLAVPVLPGTRPYQSIPVVYSLQQEGKGSSLVDFLEVMSIESLKNWISKLIASLQGSGAILVFDENEVIRALNTITILFPEYKNAIGDIMNRMMDLQRLFLQKTYYSSRLSGDYSLKHIIEALHLPGSEPMSSLMRHEGLLPSHYEAYSQAIDPERRTIRDNIIQYARERTDYLEALHDFLKKLLIS